MALSLAACSQQQLGQIKVIDGDTFNANRQTWRLARIDAPEMPNHCRRGRVCVEGNPYLSAEALTIILSNGPITCKHQGHDYYGRNLAECWTKDGLNVSDLMLKGGWAEPYLPPKEYRRGY